MEILYHPHCKNLRLIESAIKCIEKNLRKSISKEEKIYVNIHTKILSHLINSWAEVRILKLVYENTIFKYSPKYSKYDAFTDTEKKEIIKQTSLKERWNVALNISFSKAYKIPIKDIDNPNVPFSARMKHSALLKILNSELLKSSELRNRIAHGQWEYALNNNMLSINTDLTGKLKTENIIKLQLKFKMFKSLAQIIHDLAVSKPTFERDFDNHFRKIEEQKRNFHNRNYEDYKKKTVLKMQNGVLKRKENIKKLFEK